MSKIPYINDLIGVPFTNKGRTTEEGFDCYGLAIEAERRFGHDLRDVYYEKSTNDVFSENASAVIKQMSKKVYKTDTPKEGDCILFSDASGNMVHIGVMLHGGDFIHCDGMGVHVSNLDTYFRKSYEVYSWR